MNQVVRLLLLMLFTIIALIDVALFVRFSKIKNSSKFIKEKKLKRKKIVSVLIALVAVCFICYTAYCSVDLIKQDYVVADLEFVNSYSRKEWFAPKKYVFKEEHLSSYPEDGLNYALQEGVTYRVTYAPRTSMIIDIEGVEKTAGLKAIYKSGKFKDIFIVTLLIIVVIALRIFRIKMLGYKPERKWKKR